MPTFKQHQFNVWLKSVLDKTPEQMLAAIPKVLLGALLTEAPPFKSGGVSFKCAACGKLHFIDTRAIKVSELHTFRFLCSCGQVTRLI